MEYRVSFHEWMQFADDETRRELQQLSDAEIEDRFYTELEFGTAGLRGLLGAGSNRMNRYVVRRATAGLCRQLAGIPGAREAGVAIAYDTRRQSDAFALEAALVLAAEGIPAYLFETPHAVPQLSFTLRHLGCAAGIVITASHNPAAYNGYKVYWKHGGQLGPIQAECAYAEMQKVEYFGVSVMDREEALRAGLLRYIGKAEDEAYYAATLSLLRHADLLRAEGERLKLVYTPLHGAGRVPVTELLRRAGMAGVHVVAEQAEPDSAFPTVEAPNPEDPRAFALAERLADSVNADMILATDPDSDRLGVAVRGPDGKFITLTGNQIGCLLLEHICAANKPGDSASGDGAFVVKSIVSTPMADAIAARYGVEMRGVLTGFRYISEQIDESERDAAGRFLFGFEESFGYLAGGFSRDKDAICSALLFTELAACKAANGSSVYEALQELYAAYGQYREGAKSYTLTGKAGMEQIAAAMQALRDTPPEVLAGREVWCMEDYSSRRRFARGENTPLSLPSANMLRLQLSGDAWVVVRPSGTEPKLKLYAGVREETAADAEQALAELLQDADALITGLLGTRHA